MFNNLDQTIYTGDNINADLAAAVQTMWVNFAKTGDPSTEDITWPAYDKETRVSMVLGDDIHTENDLLAQQRELLKPLLQYGLNGCYTNLDLNVPTVWLYSGALIALLAVLIAGLILAIRHRKKRKGSRKD